MCTKNTALGGVSRQTTALGFASCCICLSTRPPRAVFSVHTRSSALTNTYIYIIYIKTHDSESRGQEEAGRTRRMSVLFTGSTGVKFVNALNKPPLKLSLSYQGLSAF